ncbi:MAG: glycosyltransferase [Deltaproteobacteria bacterium]|nr:glycosyltransferase [Deltaproteobacteria bacterium]
MISVIIPSYNRAWCLERSVGSVLRQEGPKFELIVVDDGSNDETRKILMDIRSDFERKRHPGKELIFVLNEKNLGVSASRNIGIERSKGELICFLDSDDEWLPGKLSAQAEYMNQNPQLLISQCQERWIRNGRRVNPGLRHKKRAGDFFVDSLSLCLISPSAVILRRELLAEVGLFDESLPACEDYDLWLRTLYGHEAGLLDLDLVVRHGGRPDQLSSASGLDRYRIIALEKILKFPLSPERRRAAESELKKRRRIYEGGVLKRLLAQRAEEE